MRIILIMSVALLLLAACETAPTLGPLGFSDEFLHPRQDEIEGRAYLPRVKDGDYEVPFSPWQKMMMRRAYGEGETLVHSYSCHLGRVEHVLVRTKDGRYVISAYLRKYSEPDGKEYLCSMNFDRYERYVFDQMVDKELQKRKEML